MSIFENYDILEYILQCDCISYVDVCRLSCVSKSFCCVSKSNNVWKQKYTQLWPALAELYEGQITDWYTEFLIRLEFKKRITNELSKLSEKYYYHENVSNEAFFFFREIAQEHRFGAEIVISVLEDIIHDSHRHANLTLKYYASKVLIFIQQSLVRLHLQDCLSELTDELTLVKGACLISEYCQPTVPRCTANVYTDIEDIAKLVFEKINLLFPHHPVLEHGLLKGDMISSSLWTPRYCKDILYCVSTVMFEELQFCRNHTDCYSAETTYIDKVLIARCGTSITLGIIYSAVAAKLGVSCLSVNFPGHFLLKWHEYPSLIDEEAYTYIDVMDKGSFKRFSDLTDLAPGFENFSASWTEAVPPIKVFIRMASYLVDCGQMDWIEDQPFTMCSALELLCLLNPDDLEHKLLLARFFINFNYNIIEARCILQEIASHPASLLLDSYLYQSTWNTLETHKVSQPPIKPKLRVRDESKSVKYAVGMIMRHKKYKYRCVIYGWDYTCVPQKGLLKRADCHHIHKDDKQPFYYVLKDDGRKNYVAQENLEIDQEPTPILHIVIGRYFESFNGSYYVPNAQTLTEYPEDIEVSRESLAASIMET